MKMQIDNWREITVNTQFQAPPGRIWVKTSHHAALYVAAMGVEVLAGSGCEVDVTLSEVVTCTVHGPKDARVFVYDPGRRFIEPTGEKFTNIDRKPMESGSVLAVRQALRDMQLQQRGMLRELREERRKARQDRPDRSDRPQADQADQADQVDQAEPDQADQADQANP